MNVALLSSPNNISIALTQIFSLILCRAASGVFTLKQLSILIIFDIIMSSPSNHGDVLNNLIGSNIRVTMTDGRVASGKFICLDRLGNIMLEDVTERRRLAYHDDTMPEENHQNEAVDNQTKKMQYTKDESGTYHWTTERLLTQAVIIGKKVAKVEIKKRELELKLDR